MKNPIPFLALAAFLLPTAWLCAAPDVTGELKQWHKVTLSWEGPESSESATPNPFTDYRLDVTFAHAASGKSYKVPGYFAADGDAANTGAEAGKIWRVHFRPDQVGEWTYTVSFRQGEKVALQDGDSGEAVAFDGDSGSMSIAESDKTGRDNRAKGRLDYVGDHYLRYIGNGEVFLKQGADAPENFLAYQDFDGDFKSDGIKDDLIKDWQPHVGDWKEGDPTWGDGKGKGMIGAVNYLASEGLNVFSFLTLNIDGDDRNVFPYTSYKERFRIDCSRMDQWEIVFDHGDNMGMFLHFKTQETENETLLDKGDTGPERTLYYRELVARFGHHLAMNWNLGEENGKWGKHNKGGNFQTKEQRQAMAQWFHDHDPYQHHIVIHNGQQPDDLLGDESKLTGISLQTNKPDFSNVPGAVANWIRKSGEAGKPWVVACDEPGDASHSLRPDNDAGNSHEDGRLNGLWGCMLNGGTGNEWYFGYKHDHSDLTCNDFRSRDAWWDYCRYALEFFRRNAIPVTEMKADHGLVSTKGDYCFAKAGEIYVVYLKQGGDAKLDLSSATGDFSVKWFNPRAGGELIDGAVSTVKGGGKASLGSPPGADGDWVALVKKG